MALSVAYQQERPNVEAADLTALVIRALGLIVGKMVRDDSGVSGVRDVSGVHNKRYFIPTSLTAAAAQKLVETLELDIDLDRVSSRRIGHVLKKMRFTNTKQSNGGSRGWLVSLDDLHRWSHSYGLNEEEITGLSRVSQLLNAANAANAANANSFEGIL